MMASELPDIPRSMRKVWVGDEALAIPLFAALTGKDYVEVSRVATNHDGDSDSTASIAAQMWGARKGIGGGPHEWTSRLDVLAPLLHLCRKAWRTQGSKQTF